MRIKLHRKLVLSFLFPLRVRVIYTRQGCYSFENAFYPCLNKEDVYIKEKNGLVKSKDRAGGGGGSHRGKGLPGVWGWTSPLGL